MTLPFLGDLISDHNGEEWRANELAGARLRLHNKVHPESPLVLPCSCLGEVGAASGAVGMCIAARAFTRKYSKGDRTLILMSSERGDVGAACLKRAS
jgi:3-oxoacyl-[acyl-carrier-protein] synthase-1